MALRSAADGAADSSGGLWRGRHIYPRAYEHSKADGHHSADSRARGDEHTGGHGRYGYPPAVTESRFFDYLGLAAARGEKPRKGGIFKTGLQETSLTTTTTRVSTPTSPPRAPCIMGC